MLSLWTRGVRGALQRLTGGSARLAGQDSLGNKYYAAEEANEEKGTVEKRWVIYKKTADPTELPVEWRAWLARSRALPPTPEESKSIELYRHEVKRKAKLLAEEDERRKFREDSLKDTQFYSPGNSSRR